MQWVEKMLSITAHITRFIVSQTVQECSHRCQGQDHTIRATEEKQAAKWKEESVRSRNSQIKCSSCKCICDPGTCKVCISCKATVGWGTSLETIENWTGAGDCWIIGDVLICKWLWLSPDESAECCPQSLSIVYFLAENNISPFTSAQPAFCAVQQNTIQLLLIGINLERVDSVSRQLKHRVLESLHKG